MPQCKGCHAEILFVHTPAGKIIPLDSKPQKRAILVGDEHLRVAQMVNTYMPHHATCPNVAEFRKEKSQAARCNCWDAHVDADVYEATCSCECHQRGEPHGQPGA